MSRRKILSAASALENNCRQKDYLESTITICTDNKFALVYPNGHSRCPIQKQKPCTQVRPKIYCFHGRRCNDYGLWRLRLRAACRVKGVWKLIDKQSTAATSSDTTATPPTRLDIGTESKLEKASGLIISALGDSPLRIVADADGDPARTPRMLDSRYASNRTVSRIAVQTQLYRMRYKDQDMSKYIDE